MGNLDDQTLLVMQLRGSDPRARQAAAFGLHGGTINDGDGTMIVQLLEDRDPEVRAAAAYALRGTRIVDEQAADYVAMVRGRS
ncbi:MAG TPA: HEAT repeat domain-containing protein [Streptosporangiaceae bacterium]|jgi:HEAT repeat protein|nr:HEAT repeat domain-containing protein [Streptosporangiaceae bacterium]